MTIDKRILPLRDLPPGRLEARREHLMAEIVRGQQRPHFVSLPRLMGTRRRIAVLAIVTLLIVIGTAVASTTSWLTGSPAPQSVVSDFGTYTPQLGFNPEPGRAVLVAEDGDISLYATTNKQGTYCLVASAPWKRPEKLADGGTCIPPRRQEHHSSQDWSARQAPPAATSRHISSLAALITRKLGRSASPIQTATRSPERSAPAASSSQQYAPSRHPAPTETGSPRSAFSGPTARDEHATRSRSPGPPPPDPVSSLRHTASPASAVLDTSRCGPFPLPVRR
jgi:hypothetical protein